LRGEVLFLSKNAPDDAACGAKIPEEWFRYGAGQKIHRGRFEEKGNYFLFISSLNR
jgi:hypothetical protein